MLDQPPKLSSFTLHVIDLNEKLLDLKNFKIEHLDKEIKLDSFDKNTNLSHSGDQIYQACNEILNQYGFVGDSNSKWTTGL